MANKIQAFGAVPIRAGCDLELTAADLRLLTIIAAHDRNGGKSNGRGCDAGRVRLAYLARCDLSTFTRSLTRLLQLGYVTQEAHPRDRRKHVYRIAYHEDDAALLRNSTNPTRPQKVAPTQPIQTVKTPEIGGIGATKNAEQGGTHATNSGKIGGIEKPVFVDSIELSGANRFSETGNRFGEPENKYAGKRALRSARSGERGSRSIASRASEIERLWKKGRIEASLATERLTSLLQECAQYSEDRGLERGQCERIIEEICRAGEDDA